MNGNQDRNVLVGHVLIVLNGGTTAATVNLSCKGKYASYHLEPAAVVTFRWSRQAKARLTGNFG